MNISFIADEIYEMAEQIERNGAKFYRTAAASADRENRDLLLRLAEMEDDHEKTFAEMRVKIPDTEKNSITADPDDPSALYLQSMADGKVFAADPSGELTGDESMEQILNIAISLEKDSIVFYQSMMNLISKQIDKDWLKAIINQEIGHILDLTKQLETIAK